MSGNKIRCPECERIYHVQESWIPECGVKIRCEGCERLLWIEPPGVEDEDALSAWQDSSPVPMPAPQSVEIEDLSLVAPLEAPISSLQSSRITDEEGYSSKNPLDRALQTWIAGREVGIRMAFQQDEFLAIYGVEFSQFLEKLTELNPHLASGQGKQTIGWKAHQKLKNILKADKVSGIL